MYIKDYDNAIKDFLNVLTKNTKYNKNVYIHLSSLYIHKTDINSAMKIVKLLVKYFYSKISRIC